MVAATTQPTPYGSPLGAGWSGAPMGGGFGNMGGMNPLMMMLMSGMMGGGFGNMGMPGGFGAFGGGNQMQGQVGAQPMPQNPNMGAYLSAGGGPAPGQVGVQNGYNVAGAPTMPAGFGAGYGTPAQFGGSGPIISQQAGMPKGLLGGANGMMLGNTPSPGLSGLRAV